MLDVDNLSFSYNQSPLLNSISFSVREEEIVILIGSSGCGKTTLFKLIAGFISPSQGQVLIHDSKEPAQWITYMRQEDLLLPWRNVINNLLLTSELGSQKKESCKTRAYELLNQLGLQGYEHAFPNELSGGMRQRVSLARALLQERPLMLLDEPFASLDIILREQLYTLLKEIQRVHKKTLLMVTHDFRDALSIADRILVLAGGKIEKNIPISQEIRDSAYLKENLANQIRDTLLLTFRNCV